MDGTTGSSAARAAGSVADAGGGGRTAPDLSVRHRPVQTRGRERFELILRTGRAQLARVGVDGFTFDAVAAAAEIPVGSIYQFFPNKHALICELSARDTDALAAALARAATQFPSDDWQADVDRLIDHLADLWRSEPGRRHVWLAMQSTALTRSLAAEQTGQITDQVVPLVAALLPDGSRRRSRTVAEVVVQMCYSLLHFSVHDDRPHPATVRELKRALRAYLRAVALDASG
jgi:AcrR family transcriptional regulator